MSSLVMDTDDKENKPKKGRVRGANYSTEEVKLLTELVFKHKDIVECKESDVNVWQRKNEIWKTIAAEFNSNGQIFRTPEQLKKKYEALKTVVKLKAAAIRQDVYGTGGGEAKAPPLNPLEQKIADMLGGIVNGNECIYDPDYVEDNAQGDRIEDVSLSRTLGDGRQVLMIEVPDHSTPILPLSPIIEDGLSCSESQRGPFSGRYCAKDLRQPISLQLQQPTSSSAHNSSVAPRANNTDVRRRKRATRETEREDILDFVAKKEKVQDLKIRCLELEKELKGFEIDLKKEELFFTREENKIRLQLLRRKLHFAKEKLSSDTPTTDLEDFGDTP